MSCRLVQATRCAARASSRRARGRWRTRGSCEAAQRNITRLTPEALGGADWVLRKWDTYEPAPASPEATLTYTDGHVAGISGCNRYTAAVKAGAAPGDLSIGPAAGTRMMCPDSAMVVEARFLRQLGEVKKFGFLMGQLALSYEHDGAVGTMLFERRK